MNPIFSHYRYGLSFKILTGESKFVTEEMTATWKEKDLPIIMSGCPLKDIFNADEFGLFYEIVPTKQCIPKVTSALMESIARHV